MLCEGACPCLSWLPPISEALLVPLCEEALGPGLSGQQSSPHTHCFWAPPAALPPGVCAGTWPSPPVAPHPPLPPPQNLLLSASDSVSISPPTFYFEKLGKVGLPGVSSLTVRLSL